MAALLKHADGSARRLLILTQYFPPEMGAPQVRLSELGRRLARRGWTVQVLTALPNYPEGRIRPEYEGRGVVREEAAGLDTVRVPLRPSASTLTIPRLWCYVSFALSAARFGPRSCQRPDLIWVESPPLFLGLACRWLARHWGVPYVFNVSDLWPAAFVHLGRIHTGGLAHPALKALERWCYRGAAGVTGQTREIIDSVREEAPAVATEVITNGVDPARFGPALVDQGWRAREGWDNRVVFIFAGLHGVSQGLGQIIELADRLRHRADLLFALIGDGPEKPELVAEARRRGLDNLRFYPPQPRDRIPTLLASADVALITLASYIRGAVPSKIYEAMASELPILLVAEGEARSRVEEVSAGIVVSPGNTEDLVATTTRLADDPRLRERMGAAGRRAAENIYSRDATADRLDAFLRAAVVSAA